MKNIFIIIITLIFSAHVSAQNAAEWTQQKKTQLKYLAEQILALQTYLGHVKTGYGIAQRGLNAIQQSKDGEWSLHKDFFAALKKVNPSVKNYRKVADIIAMQVGIVKVSKTIVAACNQGGQFSFEEMQYLQKVCAKVLSQCLENIDELLLVTTSGELQMSDNERLNRIEKIYTSMQESQVFLSSFGSSAISLSEGRQHEKSQIEVSKNLNDVK